MNHCIRRAAAVVYDSSPSLPKRSFVPSGRMFACEPTKRSFFVCTTIQQEILQKNEHSLRRRHPCECTHVPNAVCTSPVALNRRETSCDLRCFSYSISGGARSQGEVREYLPFAPDRYSSSNEPPARPKKLRGMMIPGTQQYQLSMYDKALF